jgi:hypothetical protein
MGIPLPAGDTGASSRLFFQFGGPSEIVFRRPAYRDLVAPGILFEDFAPIYADRFESRFQSEYGYWVQQNISPILMAFRRENHYQLAQQRDAYFGAPQLPFQTRYLPRR